MAGLKTSLQGKCYMSVTTVEGGRTENSYQNLKELSRTGKSKLIKAI